MSRKLIVLASGVLLSCGTSDEPSSDANADSSSETTSSTGAPSSGSTSSAGSTIPTSTTTGSATGSSTGTGSDLPALTTDDEASTDDDAPGASAMDDAENGAGLGATDDGSVDDGSAPTDDAAGIADDMMLDEGAVDDAMISDDTMSGMDDATTDDSAADDAPGVGTPTACGGELPEIDAAPFECGDAHVFENNGPPENRVNYVIAADGYQESELDTVLVEHVENMLYNEETGMFAEIGEPYVRYRKFINVCAMRSPSNESGVDGPGDNPNRDTAFDGGNCGDRLGCVDDRLVRQYLQTALPDHVDVDWLAATMNENEWWNSGGGIMVWSGKFMETSATQAASVAIHEGGHSFHQLADEYGDDNLTCNCASAREPNVACEEDPMMSSETKWGEWMGFVMEGGSRLWNLGEHGSVPGGRYCGPNSGVTRPTQDSEMNLLPYAFNMPSLQKAVHDIYEIVRPIDSHTPNDAPVSGSTELAVRLIDAEVLKVDWSVDGNVVVEDGGECFSLSDLPSGEHTVSARAYDDTPWVRDSREDLEQTVEWTVSVP